MALTPATVALVLALALLVRVLLKPPTWGRRKRQPLLWVLLSLLLLTAPRRFLLRSPALATFGVGMSFATSAMALWILTERWRASLGSR